MLHYILGYLDKFSSNYENYFKYFGLSITAYVLLKYVAKITYNFYVFSFGGINLKKYGDWAVVTGCTDGIGKVYAEKLAEKGLNVVLLSRSLDKLNRFSDELVEKYKIKTKVVAVDFTEEIAIYDKIEKELDGLDIGVLINNVGMFYQYPEYFLELPNLDKLINDMIHCNVVSLTKMTAIVLPGMVKRGGGIIVNNSSASGRQPIPLMALYSASKSYVDYFSRSLSAEYKSKGIIIQSLCPFFVATKLLLNMPKTILSPGPEYFVKNAIKTIGYQSVTNGCPTHNLQGWLVEDFAPESLIHFLEMKVFYFKRNLDVRKLKEIN